MKTCFKLSTLFVGCFASLMPFAALAEQTTPTPEISRRLATQPLKGPVEERQLKEDLLPANYFSIAFYKPSYILPYYYTGSPDNSVYINSTPNNESLKRSEFKYQFSFKIPVWKNIFKYPSSLYLAYTQRSYWQFYNHNSFFRESDYEPEIFLENTLNYRVSSNWRLNFANLGTIHESNGFGNALERAWNRAYGEAIF